MIKATRARYTLEFKQEAVRLVESGQSIAAASRRLGLVEQTLFNWVKAHREGRLKGADSRSKVTAEQMEISRLRAELARSRWSATSWERLWRTLPRGRSGVRFDSTQSACVSDPRAVPDAGGTLRHRCIVACIDRGLLWSPSQTSTRM
jgi:transposase